MAWAFLFPQTEGSAISGAAAHHPEGVRHSSPALCHEEWSRKQPSSELESGRSRPRATSSPTSPSRYAAQLGQFLCDPVLRRLVQPPSIPEVPHLIFKAVHGPYRHDRIIDHWMDLIVRPGDCRRDKHLDAVGPQEARQRSGALDCLTAWALAHPLPAPTGSVLPIFAEIPAQSSKRLHLNRPHAWWADQHDVKVGSASTRQPDIAE